MLNLVKHQVQVCKQTLLQLEEKLDHYKSLDNTLAADAAANLSAMQSKLARTLCHKRWLLSYTIPNKPPAA